MNKIRHGDLILVRGTGIISELIEGIERSKYSHVAIYVGKLNGVDILIEAEGFRQTGLVPMSNYAGMADVYTCDHATDDQRENILKYLFKEIGTHYCYRLLIWELIRYKTGLVLPFNPGTSRICSYLATDAYTKNGLDLWKGIRFPSPAEAYKPLRYVCSI